MACQPRSPDTSKIQCSNKKRSTNNRLLRRSSNKSLLKLRHSKISPKVTTSTQTAQTSDSTKTGVESRTTNKLVTRVGILLTSSAKQMGLNQWLSPNPRTNPSLRDCGIRLSAVFTSQTSSRNKESTTNRHNSLSTYSSNSRIRLQTAVVKLRSSRWSRCSKWQTWATNCQMKICRSFWHSKGRLDNKATCNMISQSDSLIIIQSNFVKLVRAWKSSHKPDLAQLEHLPLYSFNILELCILLSNFKHSEPL